jgi:PAS domain S-box-containing protein
MEKALWESEQRYRSVVDHVKEVIFQTDVAGRWTFLNRAWTEITGFAITDMLGRLFLDYVHPDDRQRNQDLFAPVVAGATQECHQAARYRTRDGEFRWVEVTARVTFDATGRSGGHLWHTG